MYIYILIKKKTSKQTEIQSIVLMECSIKEVLESFFFLFSHFKCIVHVLCLHARSILLSMNHRKTFIKVRKTSSFAIVRNYLLPPSSSFLASSMPGV